MKTHAPIHPGEVFREDFLIPLGLSEYRVAKDIGVPPRRINEIVKRKCSLTVDTSGLATRFPHLKFRSGNASGSDEAFSSGVLAVAPERMQIIAPYAGCRKKQRHPQAHYDSPESLSADALENIQAMTLTATPANKGLMKCYQRGGKLGSQAACLIRDTMKVAGISGKLSQPVAALFSVDPVNPEAGGTGHTIRVCRNAGVHVVFQSHWAEWI